MNNHEADDDLTTDDDLAEQLREAEARRVQGENEALAAHLRALAIAEQRAAPPPPPKPSGLVFTPPPEDGPELPPLPPIPQPTSPSPHQHTTPTARANEDEQNSLAALAVAGRSVLEFLAAVNELDTNGTREDMIRHAITAVAAFAAARGINPEPLARDAMARVAHLIEQAKAQPVTVTVSLATLALVQEMARVAKAHSPEDAERIDAALRELTIL
jgi:hypothetical protein